MKNPGGEEDEGYGEGDGEEGDSCADGEEVGEEESCVVYHRKRVAVS